MAEIESASSEFAPSSKAQALLVESSDSEADSFTAARVIRRHKSPTEPDVSDDDPVITSKMATRLLGNHQAVQKQSERGQPLGQSITTLQSPSSVSPSLKSTSLDTETDDSSPRKRQRLSTEKSREYSPILPNPHSDENALRQAVEEPAQGFTVPYNPKSRFNALIQKKREERLAHEAAEASKRAAREKELTEREALQPSSHRIRGSSPADDSEEDEDTSTVAKSARPTRKASRKAIEEMNRETQRISRNMQLAHQTRTKTKISKHSLLARFGMQRPAQENDAPEQTLPDANPVPSSSNTTSDNEQETTQSTPTTSPILSPETKTLSAKAPASSTEKLADTHEDGPSLEELMADRAASKMLEHPVVPLPSTVHRSDFPKPCKNDLKPKIRRELVDYDSDDELEVVEEPGMRRKLVAFERLPSKKAKEQPSHLALRSLASIKTDDGTSHRLNSASMQASLRRLARQQARKERDDKMADYKARNPFAQTEEERQEDQLQIEDAHDRFEKAKQEAMDIRKRERQKAKKDGTLIKDELDDGDESDDDEDDQDFYDEQSQDENFSGSDDNMNDDDEESSEDEVQRHEGDDGNAVSADPPSDVAAVSADMEAGNKVGFQAKSNVDGAEEVSDEEHDAQLAALRTPAMSRPSRILRVVPDDDEEDEVWGAVANDSPAGPSIRKTPQSIIRSARKIIPGLQPSDDLPIGLTQAFAATMADNDSQEDFATEEQESIAMMQDLPSPHIQPLSQLRRLSSIDMVSESVPASQAQPLDINLALSQTLPIPESPSMASYVGITQLPFDLTQDVGYRFSPFEGSRFSETPRKAPQSTVETVVLPSTAESPIAQRKGRLHRGRADIAINVDNEERSTAFDANQSAFQVMQKAANRKDVKAKFQKDKSEARQAFDEDAEESDDEYAGLGGIDGEEFDSENEDDRAMIDHNANVGEGDEPGHAMFHADHERKREEKEVSKMLHNVQTGAWRRKRAGDDLLDLSDEEGDRLARRRRKQEEWKKMRDALMMDEGVNKFARDSKKAEAFLKSIEDREEFEVDSEDEGGNETAQTTQEDSMQANQDGEAQDQDTSVPATGSPPQESSTKGFRLPLTAPPDSLLNTTSSILQSRRTNSRQLTQANLNRTLSELLEPVDSQATVDLSDSDSDSEPIHYTDLNRHYATAEADEDDAEDMGDFIVDDDENLLDASRQFKKPSLPERAPFNERRTRLPERTGSVIDRLSLLRQASSSSASGSSSVTSRMAFFTSNTTGSNPSSLLRRATTNSSTSSLGAMSGRGESVSATGVTTTATERGSASVEKEFVRKGSGGRRNAVNYVAKRVSLAEERMTVRAGVQKTSTTKVGRGGFLGSLFAGDSWA